MSSDATAIRASGVGKRYLLGGESGDLLSEKLNQLRGRGRTEREEFWALRGVDMHVDPGEVVGLVGRNGAGKSTLLKILSRITPPTEGVVEMRGRVGTLLEVGTGFHPELSGRENIYLSGTILGMRRREVDASFDEIVDFSGVEQFLETPVKRYSSGMYVRLAFAVAAHLQTDILLVDEVLAVGDAEFQRKCFGKMDDAARDGRTVVFVSHQLSAVTRLCSRCYWIDHGSVAAEGPTADVVAAYLHEAGSSQDGGVAVIGDEAPRLTNGQVTLRRVSLLDESEQVIDRVALGQAFTVSLQVEVTEEVPDAVVEVGLTTGDGVRVVTAQTYDQAGELVRLSPGTHEIRAHMDVALLPGEFTIDFGIHRIDGLTLDFVENTLTFTALNVADGDHVGRWPWNSVRGSVRGPATWTIDTSASVVP